MSISTTVDIRLANETDEAFIYSTWLLGIYYGDSWFSEIPKDIFMTRYHAVIEALLKKSLVKVACLKSDPTIILSYAVMSKDESTLHWVHCKHRFRNMGIAKSLISDKINSVTNLNDLGRTLLRKQKTWVFNPFLI